MREIKFRLVKDGKVVGYETTSKLAANGWVYTFPQPKDEVAGPSGSHGHMISHDHKDAYTGFKDSKGVEIYEGDIYETVYGEKPKKTYLVSFIAGAFCGGPSTEIGAPLGWIDEEEDGLWTELEIKVIGNIHENPKLLKKSI